MGVMNIKNLFIFIFVILVIFSGSIVSAADNETSKEMMTQTVAIDENETTEYIITQASETNLTEIGDDDNDFKNIGNLESLSENNNSRIIYVGQNKTCDGGNGTSENPFNSFELACCNLSGEDKVEINVYNGTYYLDSDLKFNTSNLVINGIGEVIIKNLKNEPGAYASFGLTSSEANFTFNNLIFDGSNCIYLHANADRHFFVFDGNAIQGIFYNCTFKEFNEALMFSSMFSRKFICCNFIDTYNYMYLNFLTGKWEIEFKYCVISNGLGLGMVNPSSGGDFIYDSVWFGSNNVPSYVYISNCHTYVTKYAIFSTFLNYLGNDTYEIIGNLSWNDGTTEGIGNLNPMTVYLTSKTGVLSQKTANFDNGKFKVIYRSNSINNNIDVSLDSEEFTFQFKNGINVIASPIYYGDNQNITIALPKISNGTVNITINNHTYFHVVNNTNSFNFTVPDELLAGTYKIFVSIIDKNNQIYGFNSTEWTISKVNKELLIETPADVSINNNNINIAIILENDATGNITVFVGGKNVTHKTLGGTITLDIVDLLKYGDNEIIVYYSGDKKYANQTKVDKITVNRVYPNINVTKPVNPLVNEDVNLVLALPQNTSGNITISVNNKNLTFENVSGDISVNLTDLLAVGHNAVLIRYSGDDWWDSQVKKETIYVSKLTPEMTVNVNQIDFGETSIIIVNLPNATGNITITTNGKDCNQNLNNGSVIFKINNLNPGNYDVIITYEGDDIYNSIIRTTSFSVPKPILNANNVIMSYTSGLKYKVRVTVTGVPVIGKTVVFTVNGKKVTAVSDGEGCSSVNIDLPPKSSKYIVIAEYRGVIIKNTIKVNSIVLAKDLKVKKSSKTLKIKVTLNKVNGKYLKNKKITLRFKGKTYYAKTNKKGMTIFKIKRNIIKNLKIGKKYTYKVNYLKDTVSRKITIKK